MYIDTEPIPWNNFKTLYIHRWLCARGALRARDVNFGSLNNEGRRSGERPIANNANAELGRDYCCAGEKVGEKEQVRWRRRIQTPGEGEKSEALSLVHSCSDMKFEIRDPL